MKLKSKATRGEFVWRYQNSPNLFFSLSLGIFDENSGTIRYFALIYYFLNFIYYISFGFLVDFIQNRWGLLCMNIFRILYVVTQRGDCELDTDC